MEAKVLGHRKENRWELRVFVIHMIIPKHMYVSSGIYNWDKPLNL